MDTILTPLSSSSKVGRQDAHGHAAKGQTDGVYWHGNNLKRIVEDIERLSFPVLAELVPVVEDVEFGDSPHLTGPRGKRRSKHEGTW